MTDQPATRAHEDEHSGRDIVNAHDREPATRAVREDRDLRGISTCWQNAPRGWHVYGAGPCFDTYEQAIAYRGKLDDLGVIWLPQGRDGVIAEILIRARRNA